jgi:arginine N-succinyltransferase
MFVIRQATMDDHATLMRLARMRHFTGAPADGDEIARRIGVSSESFAGRVADEDDRRFIFVLEDTETGGVVGMSAIRSCVAGPGRPLSFLRIRKREHYSDDLQAGHVHLTLQVAEDETKMSEMSDLVLAPPYRGHREKLGSFLSLACFHFIGLHRDWFADQVVVTLAPPRATNTRDSLWEQFGRRFINLRYAEAERFSRRSRRFIKALFPADEIYVSLLAPEARNLIGRVGPEEEPALVILRKLGFARSGRVDPLHGGPILQARLDEIPLVGRTRTATLGDPARDHPLRGFVSIGGGGRFRAVRARYAEASDCISIPGDAAGLLGAHVSDTVGVTALS